jgi:prepilin-type N-terminal cleavage/methylation domain-containing protein
MRTRGFTLIELVVVIAIVSLLATVAVPLGKMATQRVKEAELRTALRDLRTGIDAYKRAAEEGRIMVEAGTSGYPPTLDVLIEGVEDARDPNKAKYISCGGRVTHVSGQRRASRRDLGTSQLQESTRRSATGR